MRDDLGGDARKPGTQDVFGCAFGCDELVAQIGLDKDSGVARVYSYNWFGIETGTGCGVRCRFNAGLVSPGGSPRPAYETFRAKLRSYSR